MPIPLLAEGFGRGLSLSSIPYAWTVLKAIPWVGLVWLLKIYFSGASCQAERLMHGKVVMVTGGTSGIGAAVVRELASRGAQIVLLTRYAATDAFLVDYIEDLRTITNNELIYAEQVDLASLHSIRRFATRWVDNAPPRRLDMVILCASVMTPPIWGTATATAENGLEEEWMVNYLANFHLLSILSPALRAQPPDRDVRVLFSTCSSSYMAGKLDNLKDTEQKTKSGGVSYARSKLALTMFAYAFQKHLDAYKRPDKMANNARVLIVDPGFARTPGTRRWLSAGSLIGLLAYLLTWPLWWLILKSPDRAAQSHLYAAMEAKFGLGQFQGQSPVQDPGQGQGQGQGPGEEAKLIKECREIDPLMFRPEVRDQEAAKKLWHFSEQQIEQLEKAAAIKRAEAKKNNKEEKSDDGKVDGTAAAAAADKASSSKSKEQIPASRRKKKAK